MFEAIRQLGEIGIVPVIAISDVDKAVPLANALLAGDIPCAEVTFRTAEGEESIRRIAAEVPEIILGAGTVLSVDQVDKAIDAGAKFIVSPGFNLKIVNHCLEKNVAVTPGCLTPSEMEAAMDLGLDVVKFFPAEQGGGLDYIKAVAAPYTGLYFIPTGGINPANLRKYIAFKNVLACGGSWMVKKELIEAGNFAEIKRLCREAVQIVANVRACK
jgi:2-dehydro-3-deoxyphosphogluconate aldolase/(4S)-4-hydroxy-2-oxoglutarate aldolase